MSTLRFVPLALLLFAAPALGAGPYYARGDFYAGTVGTWNYDAGNQLFDDGLHGDGGAGDGVYAGSVTADQSAGWHDFKIANPNWSENWPGDPSRPLQNGRLWISGPGDVVHFRLDTNARIGWMPEQFAVANDHFAPPGTAFELIGNDVETGGWTGPGVLATLDGTILRAEAVLQTPRDHGFKFRNVGTWDGCSFSHLYNMLTPYPGYANFYVWTDAVGAKVVFEFDLESGQGRAVVTEPKAYYARGDYYGTAANGTWDYDEGNRLFDDGIHGDGAANDGVFAGDVISNQPGGHHEFKIANATWTENWPKDPQYPTVNAQLWTDGPGDVIHFQLDTNVVGDGWQPSQYATATDHSHPVGTQFEVLGSDPELGVWFGTGVPAVQDGAVLRTEAVLAATGSHAFKFRSVGTWDLCNFGLRYNMPGVGDNFTFDTTAPDALVKFEFDLVTGRGRAYEFDPTPVHTTSWGDLKTRYR